MSLFHQDRYPQKKRKFPAILHIEPGCRENEILLAGSDFSFRTYDIDHQAFSHDFQVPTWHQNYFFDSFFSHVFRVIKMA